jgi:AcrR family transcriptional regulator
MTARRRIEGPKLTRERIVDAAVHHAEAGTLVGLTIRDLARELDVSPMALYRHVRDKDDLLLAVTDVLLTAHPAADDGSDWMGYLRSIAFSLRAILREQPALTALYGRVPVTTPAAVERLSGAVRVLCRSGFAEEDAVRAYASVHTYTVGFSLLEMGRSGAGVRAETSVAGAGTISAFVSDEQFQYGLRATLAGLRSVLAPAPSRLER